MSYLRELDPDEPCDRCDHAVKFHAGPDRGSICMVVAGRVWRGERVPRGMRAKQCPCDGFVPRAA